MAEEFITEEEALARLKMTKAQLDALVAEGELRMYRDGDVNKFRLEDIELLQRKSDSEATVVIPPGKAAGDLDEESSEIELDAVEVEGDVDDSDQTSILPLDLPEAEVPSAKRDPLTEFEVAGEEASEAPTVLEEEPVAKKGAEPESTEVIEGLDAIDLDGIVDTEPAEPSSLSEVLEADEEGVGEMVGAAEAEDVTTAETSGIEPAQVESETIGLEPAESDEGTVTMEPVEGVESATVELETVEAPEPTEPQFAEPSAPGVGFAPGIDIEDIEPEDMLTRIGLIATAAVMVFGAILWYNNAFVGANNVLTKWLIDLLGK